VAIERDRFFLSVLSAGLGENWNHNYVIPSHFQESSTISTPLLIYNLTKVIYTKE